MQETISQLTLKFIQSLFFNFAECFPALLDFALRTLEQRASRVYLKSIVHGTMPMKTQCNSFEMQEMRRTERLILSFNYFLYIRNENGFLFSIFEKIAPKADVNFR